MPAAASPAEARHTINSDADRKGPMVGRRLPVHYHPGSTGPRWRVSSHDPCHPASTLLSGQVEVFACD